MDTVFVVLVSHRKDEPEIMGVYSTREKAVDAVLAIRNWESCSEFSNPTAGFWSTEEDSYQIEEQSVQ